MVYMTLISHCVQKYEEMARKDKRRYEAELATYKVSLYRILCYDSIVVLLYRYYLIALFLLLVLQPSPWMDKEGTIHDPLAPKKPQSAYFFFCHEKRRQVKEESNENVRSSL